MTQTVANDPKKKEKSAFRVIEILERWAERFRTHHTQKRTFERKAFQHKIKIYLQEPLSEQVDGEQNWVPTDVFTRNVSRSGVGFISQTEFPSSEIVVCLKNEESGWACVKAEIIRKRQVHDGFWEYGAKFRGKTSVPEDCYE